jgi:hypothetical protein
MYLHQIQQQQQQQDYLVGQHEHDQHQPQQHEQQCMHLHAPGPHLFSSMAILSQQAGEAGGGGGDSRTSRAGGQMKLENVSNQYDQNSSQHLFSSSDNTHHISEFSDPNQAFLLDHIGSKNFDYNFYENLKISDVNNNNETSSAFAANDKSNKMPIGHLQSKSIQPLFK